MSAAYALLVDKASSSAVAERPRDDSCLSVGSFNSTILRAQILSRVSILTHSILSVRLSVCPSRSGILWKRLNILSQFLPTRYPNHSGINVCDFLLLFHSNSVPVFYLFRNRTTYWSKICVFAVFTHSKSCLKPSQGGSPGIYRV